MKSWTLLVTIISIRCFGIRGEDKQAQNFSLTPIKQQGDGKRPFSAVTNIIPTYTYEYRSNQPLDVKFTSGTSIYQCTVSEIAPVGTVLESDVKVGVYSHDNDRSINFKIVEGSKLGTFKVEARRVSDFIFMDIKTKTRLNRESEPSYFFSVVAEDAASKVILDRARVNVTVSDVNDNRPIFLTRRIFATVREDVSLHSSVTQVQAVDADVGANGLIYFSFYKQTHYFAINPVSGVVTATRHLDATRKRHHMLEVVARDRSLAPYSPRTTRGCFINITVEPVNEFAPKVFLLKELQNVTEGKYGIVYSVIKISDRDKGESGQIDKVEITSGNEKGNFAVRRSKKTSDEFSIEVIKPLDREDSNHGYHHLVVNVTDKGIPIKYTTRAFHIKIIDVNDMTPTFNKSSYSATISELAPVNTPVIRVFAKDKDKGINSEIIYAITKGNEHGTFVINAETGLILTKTPLDYETKSHFSLQVAALDKGPQATRKMSFVHVSITVLDENDHSPTFEHSSYRKELYEDLLKGTSVLKVSASDSDSGSNGVIKYNIVNEEPVPFEINQDTGLISASETLDRDMGIPEYITLKVWASDFGKPIRRETETLVHFKVKSFNDNRPIFKQFHCDIELSQHAPKGTVLTRLTAVDIDFDSNNNIAYRFAVGNTGDNFVVEPKSGIVRTAKKLTKDVRKANLYVVATDGKQESADPVFLRIKIVSGRHASRLSNYVGVQCVDAPDFAKAFLGYS